MKKNKKESEERKPEVETPRPPQVMDTSRPPEKDEETSGVKNQISRTEGGHDPKKKKENKEKKTETKEKLLGESPLEIDDETTI
jgi:hypothetical protein